MRAIARAQPNIALIKYWGKRDSQRNLPAVGSISVTLDELYTTMEVALDMMEPFRPLIADSAVLLAINNGEVRPSDFVAAAGSVALTPDGRKRFIGVFERRLSQEVTHPLFGYKLSYRRLLELQARLLGRYLLGDIADFPNFTTR